MDAATLSAAYRESGARNTARRHLLAPASASIALALSMFLFGAQATQIALLFASVLSVIATMGLFFGGPRRAGSWLLLGAVAFFAYAASGAAGPVREAAPVLGAGAILSIGYVGAHHERAMRRAWSMFLWGAVLFCAASFFLFISAAVSPEATRLETAGAAAGYIGGLGSHRIEAALYGLLVLVGAARVVQVIKSLRDQSTSRSQMVDGTMRKGLSGLLLFGLALSCLSLTESRIGVLLALCAVFVHAFIEINGYTRNRRASPSLMMLRWPLAAAALISGGLGVGLGLYSGADSWGAPLAEVDPGRLPLALHFWNAFLESPWIGHGLGSLGVVENAIGDVAAAQATAVRPDAPPFILSVLVQSGVVGAALLFGVIVATHAFMIRALIRSRRSSRDFIRMLLAASVYMLLNALIDSAVALPATLWLYAFMLGVACGAANLLGVARSSVSSPLDAPTPAAT
ncbi:hypothetical protein GC169_12020 [bacterium]|nr:hypothetical protein [bacterium]